MYRAPFAAIAIAILSCAAPAANRALHAQTGQTASTTSATSATSAAQTKQAAPQTVEVKRSGPRFGLTYLGGDIPKGLLYKYHTDVSNVVTQFGWQFERQLFSIKGGPTALTELIFLAGGLDQNEFIPSASWIVGVRSQSNIEFGVGPNVGRGGHGMVFALGKTFRAGVMNVPVNVAYIPGKAGARISVLTGFNIAK
jgi:hypothetical protein